MAERKRRRGGGRDDAPAGERRWFVGLGLIWIALGAAAIATPLISYPPPALLFGAALAAAGAAQLAHAFRRGYRAAALVEITDGLLVAGVGAALLYWAPSGLATLALVLAAFFAAEALARLLFVFRMRRRTDWGWLVFAALVSFGLAVVAYFRFPSGAVWVMGLLTGLHLGLAGWGLVAFGRGLGRRR